VLGRREKLNEKSLSEHLNCGMCLCKCVSDDEENTFAIKSFFSPFRGKEVFCLKYFPPPERFKPPASSLMMEKKLLGSVFSLLAK
jgi:hypothetical protein